MQRESRCRLSPARPAWARLEAAVGVDVNRGEEAGLGGVCVDPAQRVQRTAVLHLENFFLIQHLHLDSNG